MNQDHDVIEIPESDVESAPMQSQVKEGRTKPKSKSVGSTRRVTSDPTSSLERRPTIDKAVTKRSSSTGTGDQQQRKRKADEGQSHVWL